MNLFSKKDVEAKTFEIISASACTENKKVSKIIPEENAIVLEN